MADLGLISHNRKDINCVVLQNFLIGFPQRHHFIKHKCFDVVIVAVCQQ
jgi:hypothetical protein